MTEPAIDPSTYTDAELDRALIAAARELIDALRARPRDQQRIDDAQAAYDILKELRDSRG